MVKYNPSNCAVMTSVEWFQRMSVRLPLKSVEPLTENVPSRKAVLFWLVTSQRWN